MYRRQTGGRGYPARHCVAGKRGYSVHHNQQVGRGYPAQHTLPANQSQAVRRGYPAHQTLPANWRPRPSPYSVSHCQPARCVQQNQHARDQHAHDQHARDQHARNQHARDQHARNKQARDPHARDQHPDGIRQHSEHPPNPTEEAPCHICSYSQPYPARQKPVYHSHFSSLSLRQITGSEDTGEDYLCPSCKARHAPYPDSRIKVVLSDYTLH